MRLWSIAPHYLDAKGLVALWRETLLAQAVLHGKTKGYKNHPQLTRFRDRKDLLCNYLHLICDEADRRGYNFDRARIIAVRKKPGKTLAVTKGQIDYEIIHLQKKLKKRDPAMYKKIEKIKAPAAFKIFRVTKGKEPESWEIV
ncbi:MAG: pyrimidine dimer DNA glycosylase/endonuclease V [Alphaproteobacteria bacterium]